MSIVRLRLGGREWRQRISALHISKRLCSANTNVSANEPQYPPIQDVSPLAKKLRRKEEWHNWLKSHETVEEKLFEINMPKYYGWHSVMIEENKVPYDFLPYAQYATRTHLNVGNRIQLMYSQPDIEEKAANLAKRLRSQVEEVILFENVQFRNRHQLTLFKDDEIKPIQLADSVLKSFIVHLNRILLNNIRHESGHLHAITVVPEPRLDAFWFLGGINPSQAKLEERLLRTKLKDITVRKNILDSSLVDGPVNEPIQYTGQPLLHIRSKYPLPCAEDLHECHPAADSIPHVPYEPKVIHLDQKHQFGTTIPGFWPGDPHEFGLISFHSSNHLSERPPHFGTDEHQDAVHSSAIFASYAWLLGQACYQGFSTFHDPTYPLVTQTVLTNGREWSFYLYQLNTTLLHTKNATHNPRCNMCWGTKSMALYHSIEDDEVKGFDEDVLKEIIKLYLVQTEKREGLKMKPYLGEKPHVADIDYEERREWLENSYKHFSSKRSRHWEKPEMYAWEHIFKVKFKRSLNKPRRRWFEMQGPPPDCRRLDDNIGKYIPRALRSEEDLLDARRFGLKFYPGTNKVRQTLFYKKRKTPM